MGVPGADDDPEESRFTISKTGCEERPDRMLVASPLSSTDPVSVPDWDARDVVDGCLFDFKIDEMLNRVPDCVLDLEALGSDEIRFGSVSVSPGLVHRLAVWRCRSLAWPGIVRSKAVDASPGGTLGLLGRGRVAGNSSENGCCMAGCMIPRVLEHDDSSSRSPFHVPLEANSCEKDLARRYSPGFMRLGDPASHGLPSPFPCESPPTVELNDVSSDRLA